MVSPRKSRRPADATANWDSALRSRSPPITPTRPTFVANHAGILPSNARSTVIRTRVVCHLPDGIIFTALSAFARPCCAVARSTWNARRHPAPAVVSAAFDDGLPANAADDDKKPPWWGQHRARRRAHARSLPAAVDINADRPGSCGASPDACKARKGCTAIRSKQLFAAAISYSTRPSSTMARAMRLAETLAEGFSTQAMSSASGSISYLWQT